MVTYVLALAGGNYYVGRTNNLERRLNEHKRGYGSEWSKKHGSCELLQVYDSNDPFYEDMIVKKMMKEHGINKVRGGAYSQIILPSNSVKMIENEILAASDLCFGCGTPGHFVKACIQPYREVNTEPKKNSMRRYIKRKSNHARRVIVFM